MHDADDFLKLCEQSARHPNVFDYLSQADAITAQQKIEILLVDQHRRWKLHQAVPIEHYLQRLPDLAGRVLVPLLVEEYGYLEERGIAPPADEFAQRYASLGSETYGLLCEELDVEPASQSSAKSIGRYQVVSSIGQGAFGEVFLAKDPTLDRSVAIKVLSADRTEAGAHPKELLGEARVIAKLDHPHIVPVFDFGTTDDGDCYIVSKYVKGKDLRSEIRKSVPYQEAAAITALIARALDAAHRVGVVHRDVKPGNIILDDRRQPHLLDFGLALRQRDSHRSGVYVGTPAYMSPEQKRGEGDAVDGRTDIYSLGIVLYELLTRRRPFPSTGDSSSPPEMHTFEPQPPRQFDETIPRELERICLKALASRPGDRYNTAGDFAEDLETWLADRLSSHSSESGPVTVAAPNVPLGRARQDQHLIKPEGSPVADAVVSTPHSSVVRRSFLAMGAIASLLAVFFFAESRNWIDSRSALQSFSHHYLPEFARVYLTSGWHLKPDFESGYFYHSEVLLTHARESDPSVTSVAVKTTAPRYTPVQVQWSPQGDRLAVVTRRGQVRIYHWDGKQLDLRLIYRSDSPSDWVRCFHWHPFDGSAAIATGRGIVIGTASDRGDYDISVLIGKVYETSSIHCLVDKGRVLYVFGSKTGYRAWDPLTERIYENFLPPSVSAFTSNGLSNQYAFAVESQDSQSIVDFWDATWNAKGSGKRPNSQPGNEWTFIRRRSAKLAQASIGRSNKIIGLQLGDDQTHLAVIRENGIAIHQFDQPAEPIDQVAFQKSNDQAVPCQFLPSRWPSRRERLMDPGLIWRDETRINLQALPLPGETHRAGGQRDQDVLTTEMIGAKLRDAQFDLHPSKELVAVAFAGGLEIWNARFQTVAKVPSVDSVWDVVPMQLHDKCLLFRPDGGGIVVRTDGEVLGQPIPPVQLPNMQFKTVQRNSIVEPELHLFQSTYDSESKPAQRRLTDYGITAVTSSTRHTFSLVPEQVFATQFGPNASPSAYPSSWTYGTTYDPTGLDDLENNRRFHSLMVDSSEGVAIAQRAQKVLLCDHQGKYELRSIGQFDDPPETAGKLAVVDQYLSVTVDPNATSLFAANGGPGQTRVSALDLNSGDQRWDRVLTGYENGANLVWIRDRILVTSWFGWQWIDARGGDVIADVSPRTDYGIRHGQIRKHPLEDSLYSWHRYPEVEPAAAWSRDLELQWFAFAATNGQWLILSPMGEMIDEVTAEQALVDRFVGASPDRYRPAPWAAEAKPVLHRPQDSLTLVRYHSDGRTTCQPFQPVKSPR